MTRPSASARGSRKGCSARPSASAYSPASAAGSRRSPAQVACSCRSPARRRRTEIPAPPRYDTFMHKPPLPWQEELAIVDRTMKAISGIIDPQELVDVYWQGIGELI